MPAIEMTTAQVPEMYRRFAQEIGADAWQTAVERQDEAIRSNPFLEGHLRSEFAITYELERLRRTAEQFGTIPPQVCIDPRIFPALAFAAQVLKVLNSSTVGQARTFVRRVRTAIGSAENMHGLRLELQAATHFVRRGHRVAWHRMGSGGTFDLLVEDLGPSGLEVECKSISSNKGRRVHRREVFDFWGEVWIEAASFVQTLRRGLAVVLTVPYRIPTDLAERSALANEVVARMVAGSSAILSNGTDVHVAAFDPLTLEAAARNGHEVWRKAIDLVTGTENRELVVYETPAEGMLVLVLQSAVEDDVLEQVFATLDDSASRQFTGQRGALFWVAFQGLDSDQLLSIHEHDSRPGMPPTALKLFVNHFLDRAPEHIIGVAFSSRSSLDPVINSDATSGGTMHFFLKEESPHWHASFRRPLKAAG